jgi:hypothetical protein
VYDSCFLSRQTTVGRGFAGRGKFGPHRLGLGMAVSAFW